MMRQCAHCQRLFGRQDLVRQESKGMEMERKTLGLQGVRFLYYRCPACGYDDIFVDILPLEGETPEAFRQRRNELDTAVRDLHADQVEVVVSAKPARSI